MNDTNYMTEVCTVSFTELIHGVQNRLSDEDVSILAGLSRDGSWKVFLDAVTTFLVDANLKLLQCPVSQDAFHKGCINGVLEVIKIPENCQHNRARQSSPEPVKEE